MEKASRQNNYYYNKLLKEKANYLRNNATKAEACLWKYVLKANGLGFSFKRQRPILNYIVDFVSTDLMLVIEVDGITHTYESSTFNDKIREEHLEAIGFKVLRFTDEEVLTGIDRVRNTIIAWIDTQDAPPPDPRQRGKRIGKIKVINSKSPPPRGSRGDVIL